MNNHKHSKIYRLKLEFRYRFQVPDHRIIEKSWLSALTHRKSFHNIIGNVLSTSLSCSLKLYLLVNLRISILMRNAKAGRDPKPCSGSSGLPTG